MAARRNSLSERLEGYTSELVAKLEHNAPGACARVYVRRVLPEGEYHQCSTADIVLRYVSWEDLRGSSDDPSPRTGLFTVLTTVATYILLCVRQMRPTTSRQHSLTGYSSRGIKRTATAVMLVAIVIMWMSTVSDWIATLVAAVEDYTALQDLTLRSLRRMTDMQDCIGTLPGSDATLSCSQQTPLTKFLDSPVYNIQNCTSAAALTVNVSASP